MSTNAGEANIRIVPDASGFIKKLEADLRAKRAEFAVNVTADITRAGTEIDRFRAEQERRPIKIHTEVDRSGLDRFQKDFGKVAASLGSALAFNLGAAGVGELPALAAALASVTGAVQQLLGAGAALPGVIGGVLASVGTAKLGLNGMEDAFKALDKASDGSAKNVAAANEALAKLAPNAREALETIYGFKPAFEDLQKLDQNNLFAGTSQSIKNLVNADLPTLRKGIDNISKGLNQNLNQVLGSLASDSSKGLLDRILGNTGDAQARFTKAIDPLIQGIGTLTAAGTDVLPRLADDFGKLAEKFSNFITTADQNGTLNKFINEGIDGVEHLGSTFINVGKIINDVTQSAGGGGGLLATLDSATQRLDEFLKSPEGQRQLQDFFREAKRDLGELLDFLKTLPGIANGVFQAASEATHTWLPILKDVGQTLSDNKELVKTLGEAFLAWKFVGVIKSVSDAVGLIGPAATTAAGGVGTLGTALSGLAAPAWLVALLAGGSAAVSDAFNKWSNENPDVQRRDPNTGKTIPGRESQGGHPDPNTYEPFPVGGGPGAQRDRSGQPVFDPTRGALLPPGLFPSIAPPTPITPASPPNVPTAPVSPDQLLPWQKKLLGYASGGVLPGYSPGRDNMLVPLAGGEGIVRPEAVRKFGPGVIHMLNQGFAPGGVVPLIDANGNPITPGAAPGPGGFTPGAGPAPVAPSPGGGGISNIANSFLSGLGGPLGQLSQFISGAAGNAAGGTSGGVKLQPGLAGLAQAGNNPQALNQWGTQTGEWLGNFGAKTLTSFATTLWQGGLGFFGLQNSILSPSNTYNQAAQQTAGFLLGQEGPLGQGSELNADGTQHRAADRQSAGFSPDDARAIQFAQTHAVGQKYKYGGIGPNYDCSGIASAIYAAEKGLPQGQRYFTTESDFAALGFVPGYAPGALNVGIMRGGGGPNSHMALTLPNGVNVESGGSGNTTQYGGTAKGAQGFPIMYHLPSSSGASVGTVPGVYAGGGGVIGSGAGDTIPALLTPGEHVLTTKDVQAMGGQGGVYSFRQGLHGRDPGGPRLNEPNGGRLTPEFDPNHPTGGGNFNPAMQIDTSNTSVAPPWDRNRLFMGDVLRAVGGTAHGAYHKQKWGSPQDPSDWQLGGFALGGAVPGGYVPPLPRPNFNTPAAKTIIPPKPRPPVPQAPSLPAPPSAAPVGPPPPGPAGVAPAQPQQPAFQPGLEPIAASDGTVKSHTLPAISKGITSGFATAGAIAQQAASLAIAAGTFGAGAAAGGVGGGGGLGGGGGPSISGLFQQAGKIANDIVDVGSAFLVGNVTPGTTANAYGETLRPAQNVPQTAPLNQSRNYVFNGIDGRNIVDSLQIRDAQDSQAALAGYRG